MQDNKKYSLKLLSMGVLHFYIDFACHFYAFGILAPQYTGRLTELFLVYNFIAFALQCPIGYFVDKVNRKFFMGVGIGTGLICLYQGYVAGTKLNWPVVGLICCALGNAFIHAVGSRAVMEKNQRGLMGGGIFIAFGALGVGLGDYLGVTMAQSGMKLFVRLIEVFLLPFLAYVVINIKTALKTGNVGSEDVRVPVDGNDMICLIMCLFAVLVRSYVGFILPSTFKELIVTDAGETGGLIKAMFPSFIGFFGKAAGGVLVVLMMRLFNGEDLRKMNYRYGIFALLAAVICLCAGGKEPALVLIGTILFHSVMPVTLYEIYCILHKNPAFSLGLTTLMLFAGMLPALMFEPNDEQRTLLIAVLCVLASIALAIGAGAYSKKTKEDAEC